MNDRCIGLAHGGGGVLTSSLINEVILPELSNPVLGRLDDAAVLDPGDGARLAFTTDSFVVKPLFFRGGDIGRLAVCGTVNDLAAVGASPLWLSLGMILEEGFPIADLERIVQSVGRTAREAGVTVVCGDTKVVGRGEAEGIFINTAGIGKLGSGVELSPASVRPGDLVLVNGQVGDHGIAVVSEREGIRFDTPVSSDVAPLGGLVERIVSTGARVHVMRDPTRGGLAAALNEIARASSVTLVLEEASIPVSPAVRGACDMLGFDVLSVANEGKMLVICPEESGHAVLEAMKDHPLGRQSTVIGRAIEARGASVILRTTVGGQRILEMPYGEDLPRIC